MPHYAALEIQPDDTSASKGWKKRTADRLLALRAALRDHLFAFRSSDAPPTHDRDDQKWLRLATWNIREFDSRKYGGRLPEATYFIAEIVSHFDLIAIQEVREDMRAFEEVLGLLGRQDWAYLATDVTEGTSGNGERMVFLYNRKKVNFRNVAGEIMLVPEKRVPFPYGVHMRDASGLKLELPAGQSLVSPRDVPTRTYRGKIKLDGDLNIKLPAGTKVQLPAGSDLFLPDGLEVTPTGVDGRITLNASVTPEFSKDVHIDLPKNGVAGDNLQFARTPFIVTFQSGWLKFILCTVHIYYGEGRSGLARRNAEIQRLTEFLAERASNEKDSDAANFFFVLGDFNIIGREHETWASLHSNGFRVPDALKEIPQGSNVARDKAYDQIAYWVGPAGAAPGPVRIDVGHAGIFDYFRHVFRLGADDPGGEDEAFYTPAITNPSVTYQEWRTYQMSDHLPMWLELRIDFGDDYLERVASS